MIALLAQLSNGPVLPAPPAPPPPIPPPPTPGPCPVMTLSPTSFPNAPENVSYSQTVTQSGSSATPIVYSISSGAVPTGTTFTGSTGVLAGTPTVPGTYHFTVQATDANGCLGSLVSTVVVTPPPAPGGIILQNDWTLLGSFRLPGGSTDQTSFNYGGLAACLSAGGNLLITGFAGTPTMAEVTIPTPSMAGSIGSLPTAALVQGFTDALAGKLSAIGGGTAYLGGVTPVGSGLVINAYLYYDGSGLQTLSAFVTGTTLGTNVSGPDGIQNTLGAPVPSLFAGFVSAWICPIPSAFQASLGGTHLVGNGAIPIISRTSYGPSATVCTLSGLGASPIAGTTVLGYPSQHPTLGNWINAGPANPPFNQATTITGIFFPPGSESVVFVGKTGMGAQEYGEGTSNPALAGTIAPDGSVYVYDPTGSAKGTHAYPYLPYAWVYRVSDLVAVKNGSMNPWDVTPAAQYNLTWPFPAPNAQGGGVAFDTTSLKAYVLDPYADYPAPLVHVFQLTTGSGA